MSWQALKDKFLSVGDVKYAEMKERGCGIIRYYSLHQLLPLNTTFPSITVEFQAFLVFGPWMFYIASVCWIIYSELGEGILRQYPKS